jgi:nicotinic acid mononucleotide adenylyltransferase
LAHGAVRQVPDHRQRHFIAPFKMRINMLKRILAN